MHCVLDSLTCTLEYGMLSSFGEPSNTSTTSSFLCVARSVTQSLASLE